MLTSDFDFDLPEELIAQEARARGESRLLVPNAPSSERHRGVRNLPELLEPGDLLVVNNTRVIPARLFAHRTTGAKVEILLIERQADHDWDALVRPGRKARPGTRLTLAQGLTVEVLSKAEDGRHRVRFSEPIEQHLAKLGHVPLPPYIKRPDREEDRRRYQTVYAAVDGAIAAPTAGLHFTPRLLDAVRERGVTVAEVTLHVGIGTFKPVTAELVHEHQMETERYEIPTETSEAIEQTREAGHRIVAVGTTVVRTLESAAALAPAGSRRVPAGPGSTGLFITPGYTFRVIDRLLTNFHLPRSTLLMLVSALAGRRPVLAAYAEAIEHRYRFYSYGDAMLIDRRPLQGP